MATVRTDLPGFDHLIERRGTASVKWDRYRNLDILPLWVADMDFAAPSAVIDALQRRVVHGVFGYSNAPDGLAEAVCQHLARRFDWQVQPGWLMWTPGVVPAVNVCCRAFTRPGDAVLVPAPVYPPLLKAAGHVECETLRVPMVPVGGQWRLDREALQAAWTPRTRLLLLCSPHNPLGRVFDREELAWLADWALRHDVIICADEIHADLVLEPGRRHLPIASLNEDIARRTITLMAPSKSFNIAGLGFSFAVVPDPDLRRRMQVASRGFLADVNALAMVAAHAAYTAGQDWLDALLVYLRANRDRVQAAVAEMPGLSTWHVEATHLSWIEARGIDAPQRFFERAGVGLSDGADFGAPGFVRLNFACPRQTLEEALRRMQQALVNAEEEA